MAIEHLVWKFDINIIINSFNKCEITSQSNLHNALKAVVESNMLLSDFFDDFHEADDVYGFIIDDLDELEKMKKMKRWI